MPPTFVDEVRATRTRAILDRLGSPPVHAEQIRWNPRLSKAFDITQEKFPPRSAEEALVSRYLEVEIKHLERRSMSLPSVRMGAFLTALNEVLKTWTLDDIRNLDFRGEETPPQYDIIQLNSTQSQDFLVDGMRFVRQGDVQTGIRATLRVEPRWWGLDISAYGLKTAGTAETLLAAIKTRASEINFLKGEAFSLSGEFIPKTAESFADLFLEPANTAAIDRVVKLINTKGKALENRGVLLLGPPGTGKTLAARIVRNLAQATFIWVSARDFYYAGGFGGTAQAFDIARESAPSILVFEDIDNWLSARTVDLIKTEMDGVSRSSGVVTMMTTNFPEHLPEALIDRPGRFHDVLKFGLPDARARKLMLARWLPGLTGKDLARAVEATDGYSGAHVRELARFATIISEQDEVSLSNAVETALVKLAEQRALINSTQLAGSRYRMPDRLQQKDLTPGVSDRATMTVTIKSFDRSGRRFSGMATTPEADRVGDVIEPLGAQFGNPLPLMLFHDKTMPVGRVTLGKATQDGIPFDAVIPEVAEPGIVKDTTDRAAHLVKYGLIERVSIGFRHFAGAVERIKDGGYRFLKTEILELSLVPIGANPGAVIHIVKSLDLGRPAAHGTAPLLPPSTPSGASDTGVRVVARKDAPTMKKSISEQITEFEATRQAKQARMTEVMTVAGDKGITLDAAETEEYDGLEADVEEIDKHLVRLRRLEKSMVATATPVPPHRLNGDNERQSSDARGGVVVSIGKDHLAPGIEFARYAMCLAAAKGFTPQALAIAETRYPDQTRIHTTLKAAVAAGTTTDPTWAGALVDYQTFAGDFIEFLRPATIIGKFGAGGVPSLRRVPFNIKVPGQTTGGSAYWVGEGKPKPVTKFDFTSVTLRWAKVANIAVLTDELVRFSSPSAETLVRDALAAAIIERIDTDFVDPAKAAVADVSPASITNGIAAIPSSGTSATDVRNDIAALFAPFITANLTPANGVFIMNATLALALSLMMNTLGQPEFPGVTMNGGTFLGLPVIVSQYVPTGIVILVNASDIYLSDDGQVVIDASREASLQMDDAPTNASADTASPPAPIPTTVVSMFQTNSIALRAERFINWQRRRVEAVAYLEDVAWTGGSPA